MDADVRRGLGKAAIGLVLFLVALIGRGDGTDVHPLFAACGLAGLILICWGCAAAGLALRRERKRVRI